MGRYEKITHLGDAPISADRHSLCGDELPEVARRGTMKHPNPGRLPKTLATVVAELTYLMVGAGPRYLNRGVRKGG
jgi:hypothetical protein